MAAADSARELRVVVVPPSSYASALALCALAFRDDPGFRAVSRARGARYDRHVDELVRPALAVHPPATPPRGIERDGGLVAVAIAEPPGASPPAAAAAAALVRLVRRCGVAVTWRSVRTVAWAAARRPRRPHHYLSVLAVHPDHRGRGLARALLDDLHARCAADPSSTGVALETTNPDNVPFYVHAGYALTHRGRIGGVEVWCLFRERAAGENA